jgi:hypothetical protein
MAGLELGMAGTSVGLAGLGDVEATLEHAARTTASEAIEMIRVRFMDLAFLSWGGSALASRRSCPGSSQRSI